VRVKGIEGEEKRTGGEEGRNTLLNQFHKSTSSVNKVFRIVLNCS
jgi:hypothetical protein